MLLDSTDINNTYKDVLHHHFYGLSNIHGNPILLTNNNVQTHNIVPHFLEIPLEIIASKMFRYNKTEDNVFEKKWCFLFLFF